MTDWLVLEVLERWKREIFGREVDDRIDSNLDDVRCAAPDADGAAIRSAAG
jgi:hypothetical protein